MDLQAITEEILSIRIFGYRFTELVFPSCFVMSLLVLLVPIKRVDARDWVTYLSYIAVCLFVTVAVGIAVPGSRFGRRYDLVPIFLGLMFAIATLRWCVSIFTQRNSSFRKGRIEP